MYKYRTIIVGLIAIAALVDSYILVEPQNAFGDLCLAVGGIVAAVAGKSSFEKWTQRPRQ